MSIQDYSLNEIWNSQQMRDLRRDMIEGKRVSGCADCYQEEKGGGFSMRKRDTSYWQNGWLNEEKKTVESLISTTIESDFRLPIMPTSYELDVGNLCNLACRMCHGEVSSRINQDPIHRRWASTFAQLSGQAGFTDIKVRLDQPWINNKELVRNSILKHPDQIKRLYFLGGETLIIREVGETLQYLIDTGVASKIVVAVVTNGTVITAPWLKLTDRFKAVEIAISVDGFGPYYEYIRYPAGWEVLTKNIKFLRALPKTSVGAAVTLQSYNVLNIVALFRYLDSIGLGFYAYPIAFPAHLRPTAIPHRARKVAGERLREYARNDCRPEYREMIKGFATNLETTDNDCTEASLREFMLFTNDLDSFRGQRFADTHAELLALITETGFNWTSETMYVDRSTA
jgi:MoaA/NifB/PqqE/SkfB family radical SAM enzyme